MRNILAFFLGIVSVSFVPTLPLFDFRYVLPIAIFSWFLLARIRWFASFCLGAIWVAIAAQFIIAERLPEQLTGQRLQVSGQIASLPQVQDNRIRFMFLIDEARYKSQLVDVPEKVRLNWYSAQQIPKAGEKWLLDIKLKPARGLANPGGFDYERWLFENRITATGYVYNKGQQRKLADASWYSINAWRQNLRDKLSKSYGDSAHLSLVTALLIGDRSQVNESQWQVLTATGTNHLLAISGLHVGLVAFATFWFFTLLFKRSGRLLLYCPAYKLAAIMALLAAIVYAALAGFAIPTQRALIMLGVALLFLLFNRGLSALRILSVALFIVLLCDPIAILSISFWLSFFAVLVIIYSMQCRARAKSLWWKWGRLQWVISLAMIPLLLYSFQAFSVVSPLANILAVPWVSFIVVPLVFIAALFSWITPVFEFVLQLVDLSMEGLWWVLQLLADMPWSQFYGYLGNSIVFIAGVIGVSLLLSPRGLPLRLPGLILILPMFFASGEKMPVGDYKLHLLDVGQGLSAVIETQNHTLVYDTGAKYGDSFDMGQAVVTPFLRALGKSTIDVLLISHGDNDHIGGMQSLRNNFPIRSILSGVMHKTGFKNASPCIEQQWMWDGVQFEILHPAAKTEFTGNNASCVLKVANASHSVLLTGDIEAAAEQALLTTSLNTLDVDVLVAPHHGSSTSSTVAFIEATSPEWILFPAGYQNRFGFPKQEVLARYEQHGSKPLVTGESGAIEFHFSEQGKLHHSTYRQQSSRFWHSPIL